MTDWYRRKTWTTIDEEEFFSKLGRARKDGRAQYLRVQAIELIETNDINLLSIAEKLLNKVLTDYPDNNFERSQILNSFGAIYRLRQDYTKAIDYYKRSLDFEIIYPNNITSSFLDFSELVIKTNSIHLFDFVENLLKSRIKNEIFPINKYKIYTILTIINKHKGKEEETKMYADLAEQEAKLKTSGLRYHKSLGIVPKIK